MPRLSSRIWSPALSAATVVDAVGDFAPGYTGAAADLDVTSFSVNYNPASQMFTLRAMLAGNINPATAGFYVIGVNTGTGPLAPFALIGAPGVRFNQTVRVNKDGTGLIGSTPLTATILGNSFAIDVAASLFPSTGFAPEQYGWNLWPRDGAGAGTFVTDFSPDNGLLAAGVPEPGTWAMMIIGIGAAGTSLRRSRKSKVTARAAFA